MSKLSRAELKQKFQETSDELTILSNETFQYKTGDFYFPKIGIISELGMVELVHANSEIQRKHADMHYSANMLQFSEDDFEKELSKSNDYGDFKTNDILEDIKTRANQIKNNKSIEKKLKVLHVLKEHLSEDDKFEIDMDSLESEGLI